MKYFFWTIFGIFIFIVAAFLAIPHFIDLNDYKPNITEIAKRYTGRDLVINGEINLSVFPVFSLELSGVTLENMEGAKNKHMIEVDALQVEVAVIPLLLNKQVHVEKFILKSPKINLLVDNQGKKNWVFDSTIVSGNKVSANTNENVASGNMHPSQVLLGAVGIENGTVHYRDEKLGSNVVLTKINNTIKLDDLSSPLQIAGNAVWNEQKVTGEIQLDNLDGLQNGKEAKLLAQFSSELGFIEYKGSLTKQKSVEAKGKLVFKTQNINALQQWLKAESLSEVEEAQSLSFNASVHYVGDKVNLQNVEFSAGSSLATGDVSLDLQHKLPYIKAEMIVDTLDLSPFLSPKTVHADNKKAPEKVEEQEWSADPLPFDIFNKFNADIALQVTEAKIPPVEFGKATIITEVKNGIMSSNIAIMEFYEGEVKGAVVIDASANTPTLRKRLTLHHVNIEPYLHDIASFDKLSGTLDAAIDMTANGKSQKAMVATLNGKGNFFLVDGKLKGVDLNKMVRNVSSAFTSVNTNSSDSTEFSELSGSVALTDGVVNNNDLLLKAPLIHMTGAGMVNLPNKKIDYTLTPKVVGTLKGSQQSEDLKGLTVPVRITGSFDKPKFAPALGNVVKDVLSDPNQVKDKLKGFERGFRAIRDGLKDELRKEEAQ